MRLSFAEGKFILYKPDFMKAAPPPWARSVVAGSFETTHIGAAHKFVEHADSSAKKVFNRYLVKKLQVPPWAPAIKKLLDPHQIDGVEWILSRTRSYLAHAPGAGKTAQIIVAAEMLDRHGPALIIVPPNLLLNWEREIQKWSVYGMRATVATIIDGALDWTINTDFILIPDSMLAKRWVLETLHKSPSYKLIAVDEADRFKEISAARTRALFGGEVAGKIMPGLVQKGDISVLMSGSPMPNRPIELWAPTIAMAPLAIDGMTRKEFGDEYCAPTINRYGYVEYKGAAHLEKLKSKLRKYFMHVVGEAGLRHPERLRKMIYMTSDPRTKDMREFEKKFMDDFSVKEIFGEDEDNVEGSLSTYRRHLGVAKASWVASYVSDLLDYSDESVIVFAWHRDVVESIVRILEERKFTVRKILGGLKRLDMDCAVQDFQSGRARVLVANISAAGTGLNMQRAGRVVFAEYSWTDELNKQCEKRASRKGRAANMPVKCDYIVVPHSIDEIILTSIFKKMKSVSAILN